MMGAYVVDEEITKPDGNRVENLYSGHLGTRKDCPDY